MCVELDVHPLLLRPGEGETTTDRPERTLRILAELEQLIVTWFRYEPGEHGPDPHIHRRHTDAFYVLQGEVEFGLGPNVTSVPAPAGSYAAAPPGLVHTFRNSSDATAVFLNVHAPSSGFGDVLRGGGEEHFDQEDPPSDGGRALEEAIVATPEGGERHEREHGMIVIKGELPQLSVLELTFRPGWEGVPPHVHDDHVDAFLVLQGEVDFVLAGETRKAGPETFVAAPPGASHGFANASDQPIRVLNLHAPETGFVERVRGH
jgi:quercetin dioxygenase-like cupin family protein